MTRPRTRRIAVVNPVDMAQDNQRLDVHHRGDQPRQFVVVGEHQFRDRDRVIFVDDRHYTRRQHSADAVFLIQIEIPAAEVVLRGQHLSAGDPAAPEQVVVAVDQLGLPHGRVELPRRYVVEFQPRAEFAPSRSHRSRGDENHLDSRPPEGHHLIHQGRHPGHIQCAVAPREYVAAHLDCHPLVCFHKVSELFFGTIVFIVRFVFPFTGKTRRRRLPPSRRSPPPESFAADRSRTSPRRSAP